MKPITLQRLWRPSSTALRTRLPAIEQDFHIPINAYAWVRLDGFIKVIDTLGGVDIDVLHPIVDDTYSADITSPTIPMITRESTLLPALSTWMAKQRWNTCARDIAICLGMSGATPASRNFCWLSNRSWTRGTFSCILRRPPPIYRGVC